MKRLNETGEMSWGDLLPGGEWNVAAEGMAKTLKSIAQTARLNVVFVRNLKDPAVAKWAKNFPGVVPFDQYRGPKGALYDPKGNIHFNVWLSEHDNMLVFDGPEFTEEMTAAEFIEYVKHARKVNALGKHWDNFGTTDETTITESKWSRLGSTDEQEEAIADLEKALKAKNLTVTGAVRIGKAPQTVVLDIGDQENAIYIQIDRDTDECYYDIFGDGEKLFMPGAENRVVEAYLKALKERQSWNESGSSPWKSFYGKDTVSFKDLKVGDTFYFPTNQKKQKCTKLSSDGQYCLEDTGKYFKTEKDTPVIPITNESDSGKCTVKDFVVFDNGGETADRYTVYCRKWGVGGGKYGYLAMSEDPNHPQGFSQWGEGEIPSGSTNIGKRIKFSELPAKVQKHVWFISNQELEESTLSEENSKPENYYLFVVDLDERGQFNAHVEDHQRNVVFEFTYPNNEYNEDGELEAEDTFFEDGWVRNTNDIKGWKDYLEHLGILTPHDTLLSDESEFEEMINPELELAETSRTFAEARSRYFSPLNESTQRKGSSLKETRKNESGYTAVITLSEGVLSDKKPATLEVFNSEGVLLKTLKYTYDGGARTNINNFCRENGFV